MALCLLVGAAGAGITISNIHSWYLTLDPPPATPPNRVFYPVWTVLYTMMGVAAWRVWRLPNYHAALTLWGWQLGLNALWTPVFFGLHLLLPALAVLLGLNVMVVLTIGRFYRQDKTAAFLLLPYLGWTGFAVYLNAGFWWLNH